MPNRRPKSRTPFFFVSQVDAMLLAAGRGDVLDAAARAVGEASSEELEDSTLEADRDPARANAN